ncbi:MAG: hypothetical protein H6625_07535 [Bdellovibrionaceae bacterium]|nr:hypothetical protein [Pseudobdellovibrionaceae bacterium]
MKEEITNDQQKREFSLNFIFKGLKLSFFSFTTCLLLSACMLNNQIHGNLGSVNSPSVSFASLTPAVAIGNSSTTFSFQLTYENVESVNLQNSYIVLSYTGSVNCNSPIINNAQSMTPSLNITNCNGDGTLKVILSPGTGKSNNGTQDEGIVSLEVTVDNTLPSVFLGSPNPSIGGSSTSFDFPVTFSGADTINLTAGDIIVNDGGGGSCDAPVITDGNTTTPTVTLNNCVGNGTVGITINANVSQDLASNQNATSSASPTITVSNAISCPTGGAEGEYIPVPGNAAYGTSDFCVMKYEAKAEKDSGVGVGTIQAWGCDTDTDPSNGGNGSCSGVSADWVATLAPTEQYTPVAKVSGRPWRSISRNEAVAECQSLGVNYDLITNDEWQTVARNIELIPGNWKENKVGGVSAGNGGTDSNELNRGHADSAPYEPLSANASDAQGCDGTGQTCNGGTLGDWSLQKRTHSLSNGEVIWDLGGNVWEWVKDDYINIISYGLDSYISQITSTTHTNVFSLSGGTTTIARNAKDQFGPLGDYTSLSVGGLGIGNINNNAGGILRGGSWSNVTSTGVFTTNLNVGPSYSMDAVGFRCVFHP